MDSASTAPADPPVAATAVDVPPIGVASLPAPSDLTRPPVPVPSLPLPSRPLPWRPSDPPAPAGPRRRTEPPPVIPLLDDDVAGFGPGVAAKLRSYVYLLVDPRSGRPFYAGRGRGDRCFDHVRAARRGAAGDRAGSKRFPMLERIREIESGGRPVRIDLLRYGLDPEQARLVEGAAHDLLGLAGEPKAGSQRRPAGQVGTRLAKRAKFKRPHQVVLLRVDAAAADPGYESTRHGWRVGRRWTDPEAPRSPRWAATVIGEMVVAVYRIERWEPAGTAAVPGVGGGGARVPERYSFVGRPDPELERRYVGRSVAAYVGPGSTGPVTYVWCGPHWVGAPG